MGKKPKKNEKDAKTHSSYFEISVFSESSVVNPTKNSNISKANSFLKNVCRLCERINET